MSSLIKLLSPKAASQLITGDIEERKSDGTYSVNISGRTLSVRSLVEEALPKKSRVIVVQVQGEFYIINKERVKDRQPLKVAING